MELRLDQAAGMSMGILEPSAVGSPCLRVQARQRVLVEPRSQWLANAVAGQPLTMTFADDREQPPCLIESWFATAAPCHPLGLTSRRRCSRRSLIPIAFA